MHQPHFSTNGLSPSRTLDEGSVGDVLIRAATCLTALLQGPTATAGLNESRYHVLDMLRRMPGGTSTQTELAARLLQSESNLSTLLERMRQDQLITRERSETDRRKSLIGLTPAGRDALARADFARSRAMAAVFAALEDFERADLSTNMQRLLHHFEGQLGIAPRINTPEVFPGTSSAAARNSERRHFQGSSLISDGLTP